RAARMHAGYSVRMSTIRYTLFDTTVGRCAIAWGDAGLVSVQLPEASEARTRAFMLTRFPDAMEDVADEHAARARAAIVALLHGEPVQLDAIVLDMTRVPEFHCRVYVAARAIAAGQTITYGELAARIGAPGAARAVGQALGRNPFPIVVPCHRVLAAGGRVGGFTAPGGIATKLRLLRIEQALAGHDSQQSLAYDPQAGLEHLRACDKPLARLIERVGPYRLQLKRTPSLFAALAEAIVYQQLNGRAAASIHARLCALFPNAHHGPDALQLMRMSDDRLRAVGLSSAKLAALRDLGRKAVDGELPTLEQAQAMEDELLIERLTQVRGIGRWTVEMLLMFRLGRGDVLPVDDYGIRQGFTLTFRNGNAAGRDGLTQRGERWRPYRSVASWYLWRAVDLARN
ncbi:MAG: methylated-DNA--[protein]-cysteine S-methyltransferase, partial [Burkholderiales bacterium]|nr:methylated-DNA--[protein]-cysteine S-methyltransferase [Burkholderiales bacterium]